MCENTAKTCGSYRLKQNLQLFADATKPRIGEML